MLKAIKTLNTIITFSDVERVAQLRLPFFLAIPKISFETIRGEFLTEYQLNR